MGKNGRTLFDRPKWAVVPMEEEENASYYFIVLLIGYSLQPGHYSSLPAPNFQPTATPQKKYDQCGNEHYSRALLMMGILMPETC